jgi:hypothetical protein
MSTPPQSSADRRATRDGAARGDGGDPEDSSGPESGSGDDSGGGRLRRTLVTVSVALGVVAAGLGIFFKVDPGAAPCLGGRSASFTGAPVFPHYPYRQFLQDMGSTDTSGYTSVRGAEVRYSYQVDDLRGQRLVLRATLVSVNRDGSIRSADTSWIDKDDLFVEDSFTPDQCSQAGGGTFFAHMPINPRGRYRIILELFVGMPLTHRIALGQTPDFTA